MTTYARREVVTTRVEYGVAAGSDIGAFERVKHIAHTDYATRRGLAPDDCWFDDWAKVHVTDDEIVIAFQIDKSSPTDNL